MSEQSEKRVASDVHAEDMTFTEEMIERVFGKRGEDLREEFERQFPKSKEK